MISMFTRTARALRSTLESIRMPCSVNARRMLADHEELAGKLAEMERRYDRRFKPVFAAIREVITPRGRERRRIGFEAREGE